MCGQIFIEKVLFKLLTKSNHKEMISQFESNSLQMQEYESNSESDTERSLNSNFENLPDSNVDSDSEDSDDQDSKMTVGAIVGINKPTLSPPLLFYIRIDGKSYKSCCWVTKEKVCQTQRGSFLYNLFVGKHTSFHKFIPFKTNNCFASNKKFNLYVPFNSNFDEGHVTPEYIVTWKRNKYLVKWLSLDIQQSTWEKRDEIPYDLIKEFKQRKRNTHPICFDPMNNQTNPQFKPFIESPLYKSGNKLTDYQIEGLNWLQLCWFQKKNSILSDEMGLGKTIESIAMLVFLSICYSSWGPFLVVCPLSTVTNWINEFKKWTNFRVVTLVGDKESRKIIKENMIYSKNNTTEEIDKENVIFDVLVVSYEWLNTELKFIKQFNFMYTIIDEAQRIKNAKTNTFKNCISIQSYHTLLMTGTPIQNNLFEIWSLLHFINPTEFNDYDEFEFEYSDKENAETIEKLQEVLQPYIFRRKKNDVNLNLPEKEEIIIEVEMTQIQRTFSQLFYKDNFGILNESLNKLSLNNIMMQFRKLYCHPFLFPNVENIYQTQYKEMNHIPYEEELTIEDEMKSLISASGKTILIDKLLPKLREGNHKILIFSQFTSVLDILEDYLTYKQYPYERLDGQSSTKNRMRSIEKFQQDEETFIFLLSTRAGGLGINLTKADTVIIYDSDWNPQNDIQAQARCHRIGQINKVNIYRLVTRGTYESEMFLRASKKLGLDYAILDSAPKGNDVHNRDINEDRKELEMILKKGAYYTFKDDSNEIDKFCSENIDQILERRSHTRRDVVSGGNSKFSKATFEASSESDLNRSDFWDKLFESQASTPVSASNPNSNENAEATSSTNTNTSTNRSTSIITRKKKIINYSDTPKRNRKKREVKIREVKIRESLSIVHFPPKINEEDCDSSELENLKLSDFCDIETFTKSIDQETYEQALYSLRHNGIGCSNIFETKTIREICKTLAVYAFFGMPIKDRKYYYSYIKEFIPDFSKQIKKTPFKTLTENFVVSVCNSMKLKIIDESFNWDVLYKIALYITNDKLPDDFQFAPEMPRCPGWTTAEDIKMIISFVLTDKHTDFVEDENLPFKEMIEKNPSMKSWIFTRLKLILYELYQILPNQYSIYYKAGCVQMIKKIGNYEKFSKLNQHILYSKRLTIYTQKKLLRILYLYGIPKIDGIRKIKKILRDEFVSEESILIFTIKVLIKAMKYQRDLINLLYSLPQYNLNEIQSNNHVDISWIKETAIISLSSNLYLIYKVRENYKILNSGKYKNIQKKLGKWKEVQEYCEWWDYQCDITLFNVTAFYGFFFNSLLCYYLIPNKPRIFECINETDIKAWKEQELTKLTPTINEKVEHLNSIFSNEMKKNRVNNINDLIEKFKPKSK